MPSRKFSLLGPLTAPAPSRSPNDSNPIRGSPSIVRPALPDPLATPRPRYPDYMNDNAGPGWDAALTMGSILNNIPALPLALAGPFTQVLDVVSEIIDAVKAMHEGKDGCAHLILRTLTFLDCLVGELKESNGPILDGGPTAASTVYLEMEFNGNQRRCNPMVPFEPRGELSQARASETCDIEARRESDRLFEHFPNSHIH
ncbi:hypothetical protein BS47DRAFT_1385743 [Hydnum rufescens UP504]|uniref:Uncharacterized protein n=1 Tax=Hydnum rufescens UP504 TaxID=1448309 RepID=A0A9P6AHM2_9AGAM|nr:hypothetical protein BS47DRAFT_1385743 [Hydnum rufescens UP504]